MLGATFSADAAEPPHQLLTEQGREVIDGLLEQGLSPTEVLTELEIGIEGLGQDGPDLVVPFVKKRHVVQSSSQGPTEFTGSNQVRIEDALLAGKKSTTVGPNGGQILNLTFRTPAATPDNGLLGASTDLDLACIQDPGLTEADLQDAVKSSVARRRDTWLAQLSESLDYLDSSDILIMDVDLDAGVITVEWTGLSLDGLLSIPKITGIEPANEAVPDAGYGYTVLPRIDGRELENLIQSSLFYDGGVNGAVYYAIEEGNADEIYNGHPGLSTTLGFPRIGNCTRNPSDPDKCTWTYPSVGAPHATAVASIALGDITLGQDSDYSGTLDRQKRSGVARAAGGFGIGTSESTSWRLSRMLQYGVDIFTASYSTDSDAQCTGRGATARRWNAMFESGITVIKSAGNNGHSPSTDCQISSPGAAIGVFPVGAYIVDDASPYAEEIQSISSRGGTSTEGRGRTIVGVTAPSNYEYAYPHYDRPEDDLGNPYFYGTEFAGSAEPKPHGFVRTSSAAPAVAGAAGLIREYFEDLSSSYIGYPGTMYSLLLLFGDRHSEGGTPLTKGYDNLWGAGRLRLRKMDSEGLDNPWAYSFARVCVGHGQDVYVVQTSSPYSSDAEIYKSVAWWYDHRHDDDTGPDNDQVRMYLEKYNGSSWVAEDQDISTDNRQRIFRDDAGGKQYRIRLNGHNVTSDDEGCGTNATRVYYAVMVEDNDRESGENLDEVRKEDP